MIGLNIHHSIKNSSFFEMNNNELTGGLNSPLKENEEMLNTIQFLAEEIKAHADVLVVVGVGGPF